LKNFINNLIKETINKNVIWENDPSISHGDFEYCLVAQYKKKIVIIKKDTKSFLPVYTLIINSEEIRGYSSKVKELFKCINKL